MQKQPALKPVDIAIAIALAARAESRAATYSELGARLGISSSTSHQGVSRLQSAGLLRPGSWEPNARALRNFLVYGVRHAFPPAIGREVKGIPTAHAGPVLKDAFDSSKPVVWPDTHGEVRGTGLTPLYPQATSLPERAPEVYSMLTLVDALRVGQARERKAAIEALEKALGISGQPTDAE
jgi:DNA-binding Lrp family transcriptional regulator